MRVFQVLTVLAFGDAIGNHVMTMQRVIREMGYETGIYAEIIDVRLPKGSGFLLSELPDLRADDTVIYHLSTGTDLNYQFGEWKCRKIVYYHNITPPKFFRGYNLKSRKNCEDGLKAARYLADVADYCLVDSEFNKRDLRELGYRQEIDVLPILIPFADYEKKPSEVVLNKYKDGRTNILFTGRIAPNKKQEDVILAFYYYKRYQNPQARLFLVGNYSGMERYYKRLKDYIEMLGVEDVYFTGHIKFDEILAYYQVADVFLCMSEHEGFCVPLVEAMYFKVPIAAYSCTAVPDTLGSCGLLLEEKDAKLAAEALNRLAMDQELRKELVRREQEELKRFSYEQTVDDFKRYMRRFLGETG